MIVVDSSVWIDFLNGRNVPHVRRLREALAQGRASRTHQKGLRLLVPFLVSGEYEFAEIRETRVRPFFGNQHQIVQDTAGNL